MAAHGAGAFPFAAGGYITAEQLASHIAPLRAAGIDFGVNLFVPRTSPPAASESAALAAYRTELRETAGRYGAVVPDLVLAEDDPRVQDYWAEKLDLLLANPVAMVSFTFGLAPARIVAQLQKAGTQVVASVTSVAEALAATETGVDALLVQHASAGGHTAAFLPGAPNTATLADLVAAVRAAVTLPLVGAGGIASAADVRAVLAAGAEAAAIGTALIRTDESGARSLHKDALADPLYTRTALTRAFTGKPARALVNEFVRDHSESAPHAYPEVHFLTAPLRAAASAAQDPRALNLWAGSGWKSAQSGPAADVIKEFLQRL